MENLENICRDFYNIEKEGNENICEQLYNISMELKNIKKVLIRKQLNLTRKDQYCINCKLTYPYSLNNAMIDSDYCIGCIDKNIDNNLLRFPLYKK
jgi:hypothetical protein